MKAIILLSGTLLLIACENAPVRREDMISAHPDWNKSMVTLVKSGFLAKGMTKEQVTATWGRHCWSIKCTGTASGKWGESWEYPTQIVFFDLKGKVTRWEAK